MANVRRNLIDSGLKYFDYYANSRDIFPNISIDGGITISLYEKNYKDNIEYANNGIKQGLYSDVEIFFSNQFEKEVYDKIHEKISSDKTMLDRVLGDIGRLQGDEFGFSKKDQVTLLKEESTDMKNPIKVWANSGFGKASRYSWHFIELDDLADRKFLAPILKTRKVMLDKKGHAITFGRGNIVNSLPKIVGKNVTASGDVYFIIPENDCDYDLSLIKSLFMTKTARFLMSIKQKDLCVRGFEMIPDYTLFKEMLNGETFTDSFFYREFNFSDELKQYIEDMITEKVDTDKDETD